MRVSVQCHRHGRVPESFGHYARMNAGLEGHRGVRMAEVMDRMTGTPAAIWSRLNLLEKPSGWTKSPMVAVGL